MNHFPVESFFFASFILTYLYYITFRILTFIHSVDSVFHLAESSGASVELPPELCLVIMSPLSIATLYTFSFLPSIMHRVESLQMSANLRSIIKDHCMLDINIPTSQVFHISSSPLDFICSKFIALKTIFPLLNTALFVYIVIDLSIVS